MNLKKYVLVMHINKMVEDEAFRVLPLTLDMADIQIIQFLQDDGIGFFSKYMKQIAELMEKTKPEFYSKSLDIKYFRSFLKIYYFDNICIDNNQRWVYFAKAVKDDPNIINLIMLFEDSEKVRFIDNVIPYLDYYEILDVLCKKNIMKYIQSSELLTRIHQKKQLNIMKFFRSNDMRELTIKWLEEYISENNCYRSFATLNGEQILNIGDKFCEMNKLNKQLLDIYYKGITNERREKFKNYIDDNDDNKLGEEMTFLNRLFLIIHRLMAICVLPMLKLIKNLDADLITLERYRETISREGNVESLLRIRMLKAITERLKEVDSNKELVVRFYTEETVKWIYTSDLKPSDKLDDILISFIGYVKEPFIKLYFDKELYYVFRKILSNNTITNSNYIRGEVINLFTAYIPFQQYYLNIWLLNDEPFIKKRLVELFICFNELDTTDAGVYKNQTLVLLKQFHNKHFIHDDNEVVHQFSHLLLECYKNYYDNYIAIIKCLHNYDYNIPFSQQETQNVRRDSPEECVKNATWFQKNLYSIYDFINNTPVIKHVMLPGTKEKFIVMVGNLLKIFIGENRRDLKLHTHQRDEIFEQLQHLFNIYSMFAKFSEDKSFRKGLVEETRFIDPIYIKKMLDILLRKNKILQSEYENMVPLYNYIIQQREKDNEVDHDEIPDEFLDPIMGTLIDDPVCLPNSDIIIERDVILRHLLENGDNPFNREPLTKKELEEFNEREEILAKINDFNERKAKYSDS